MIVTRAIFFFLNVNFLPLVLKGNIPKYESINYVAPPTDHLLKIFSKWVCIVCVYFVFYLRHKYATCCKRCSDDSLDGWTVDRWGKRHRRSLSVGRQRLLYCTVEKNALHNVVTLYSSVSSLVAEFVERSLKLLVLVTVKLLLPFDIEQIVNAI